jgi:hypothetical protein
MTATRHGIDFSGASDAGHGIWIATAAADGDRLRIESCQSAAERFGVADRAPCLGRLVEFLRDATVAGLDFPFGVPADLHDREDWAGAVEWVTTVAHDADGFQRECKDRAESVTGGDRTNLPRETDGPVGAMCPYAQYVYKQTFHGIRDVLAPLARAPDVAVEPMGPPASDHDPDEQTRLCEVYPAATLAGLDLPAEAYKDGGGRARDRRRAIVDGLEAETAIEYAEGLRGRLVDDAGGDAIDSVVAALATHRAANADFEPGRPYDEREGHIYV